MLKGEKPANLPVLLPAKFDLVINARPRCARNLLAPTDEVIE
jgi:hypothetical protein